jgi:hypothetical protein
MSLTSYQTAPPRDLERPIITAFTTNANDEFAPQRRSGKIPVARSTRYQSMDETLTIAC